MRGGERERDIVKQQQQQKKQQKAFIRKGCSHSGLSRKIQSERAGWRDRINEAFVLERTKGTQKEGMYKGCPQED